jgi:hypothetical protein
MIEVNLRLITLLEHYTREMKEGNVVIEDFHFDLVYISEYS